MNNDFPFNPSQFDTIKKALEKKIKDQQSRIKRKINPVFL